MEETQQNEHDSDCGPSSPQLPLPPPLLASSTVSSANNQSSAPTTNGQRNNRILGNFPDINFLNDPPGPGGGGPNGGGGGFVGGGGSQETKVIYHIDDEMTPYLVKIPLPSVSVTLRDFKVVLNKQNSNYKYFFKSMDADFGVVKEEIVDDSTILPCFNGRVVSWLVSADGSNISDNCSELQQEGSSISQVDHHHHHHHNNNNMHNFQQGGGGVGLTRNSQRMSGVRQGGVGGPGGNNSNMPSSRPSVAPSLTYQSASVLSSDLDSTSMFETESEVTFDRDMTECSSVQRLQVRKKPQRRKKRPPSLSRTSSYSSITDSTMSLNIITVSINMDTVNFLGISIVGQSNRGGDGGIYVGSIMKGGAVALDGRIEPGDMILQVNDINFENMTNDEAVRVLRDVVQKPGPIKLVVAKCWDPNPKGYFTIPRTEPVRPIDPGAWVAHTQAIRNCPSTGSNPNLLMMHENQSQMSGASTMKGGVGMGPGGAAAAQVMKDLYYRNQVGGGISTSPGGSPLHNQMMYHGMIGGMGGVPGGGPGGQGMGMGGVGGGIVTGLSIKSSLKDICRRMFGPDSGLEIRDRMWLKITIPNAFIGADCVNWIQENVAGVEDRREARRIVSSMLRNNYIKHTVNKLNFSEQCYYALGQQGVALMNEMEHEGSNLGLYTGGDTDSLLSDIGPLPNPPIYMPPYSGAYQPPTLHADGGGYQPIHYGTGGRMSSGSSSSDVLTSKDMSASQSDITSIIQQTGHMTLGGMAAAAASNGGSNKSSSSSTRGGGKGGGQMGHDDHQMHGMFV